MKLQRHPEERSVSDATRDLHFLAGRKRSIRWRRFPLAALGMTTNVIPHHV